MALSSRRMRSETISTREAEQALTGRALRALREGLKLTQGQAGAGCIPRITSQAWQKYESGERKFSRDTIERLAHAIGVEPADIEAERHRQLGEGASLRPLLRRPADFTLPMWGRARAGPEGPQVYDVAEPDRMLDLSDMFRGTSRATTVAGESMEPWVLSGGLVIYDTAAWPRRGDGCVVELNSGELLVKFYKRVDGSTLFIEELAPERREIRIAMREVKGVYAVTFRGN